MRQKTGWFCTGWKFRGAVCLFLGPASSALAWIGDWGLAYSAVHTDNIARTPTNERQEWIHIGSASLSLREATEDMTARLFSRAEYRHYARETYDDEALVGLDGTATWAISPRQLTFTIEDHLTQVPITPTQVTTPENRQDTNVFSLGPDAVYRFSPATRGELGGRYTNIYYGSAPNDSDRITAYTRLARDISPITTLSLTYEPSWVDYSEEILNPDYFRQDVYVSGHTRRPTTDFNLDVGRIFIERDVEGLPDIEGRLLRAGATRRLNSRSTMGVYGVEERSEAGRDQLIINPLVQVTPSPVPINTTDFVGGGLYRVKQMDVNYVQQRDYGVTRLNVFWRDLDFESPQLMLDQRIRGGFADIGFEWSSAVTTAVFGNFNDISYRNVYREDQDFGVGVRGVYRFHRNLSFAIEGRVSGLDSNIAELEYDERRVVFTIAYDTDYAQSRANPLLDLNNPLYR